MKCPSLRFPNVGRYDQWLNICPIHWIMSFSAVKYVHSAQVGHPSCTYANSWYIQTTATGYEYSSRSMLSPLACTCCIYSEVSKVLGHPTEFRAILHRHSIKKWLVCSLLWLKYWGRLCLPLQIIERSDYLLVDAMMSLVHVVDCVFRVWKKWHSNDV